MIPKSKKCSSRFQTQVGFPVCLTKIHLRRFEILTYKKSRKFSYLRNWKQCNSNSRKQLIIKIVILIFQSVDESANCFSTSFISCQHGKNINSQRLKICCYCYAFVSDLCVLKCSDVFKGNSVSEMSKKEKTAAKNISFMSLFERNQIVEDRQEADADVVKRVIWVWHRKAAVWQADSQIFLFPLTHHQRRNSLTLCDGLTNVLLATLKSLQVITALNRKQWLPGSQEVSTIKTSGTALLRGEILFTVVLFHIFKSISRKTKALPIVFTVCALLSVSACKGFD